MTSALTWGAGTLGIGAAAYVGWVGATWLRYGRPAPPDAGEADPLLDRFMPAYEVAERHQTRVAAPAGVAFAAACEQDLMALPPVQAIFKAREIVLGGQLEMVARPRGRASGTSTGRRPA
jgi:hypothetical protein